MFDWLTTSPGFNIIIISIIIIIIIIIINDLAISWSARVAKS